MTINKRLSLSITSQPCSNRPSIFLFNTKTIRKLIHFYSCPPQNTYTRGEFYPLAILPSLSRKNFADRPIFLFSHSFATFRENESNLLSDGFYPPRKIEKYTRIYSSPLFRVCESTRLLNVSNRSHLHLEE